MVVLQHVHRVIGDVDGPVDIAVGLLHAGLADADNLEGNAIDANGLIEGGHAGEEFVASLRAEHGVEAVLLVIGVIDEATLINVDIPDVLHRGIDAGDAEGERAVFILDGGVLLEHAANMAAEGDIVAQKFDIVVSETDEHASLVAACLFGGAPRKHANRRGAETLENVLDGASEAVAVGKQQNYGSDAPRHAGHSEKRAAQIVAHGGDGLLEEIAVHGYSLRRASTGSSMAARRAG